MTMTAVGSPRVFNARRSRGERDDRTRRAGVVSIVAWADCPLGLRRAVLVSAPEDLEEDVAELRRRLGYVTGETIRLHVPGGPDAHPELRSIDHVDLVG